MAGDINIVAIVKGEERYVFMFDEDTRAETLRTLGRFASNPELSFSWYDAAVLSQKIRKTSSTGVAELPADNPLSSRTQSNQLQPGPWPDLDLPSSDDLAIGDDPFQV